MLRTGPCQALLILSIKPADFASPTSLAADITLPCCCSGPAWRHRRWREVTKYLKVAGLMSDEHRVEKTKRKCFTWWRIYVEMRCIKVGTSCTGLCWRFSFGRCVTAGMCWHFAKRILCTRYRLRCSSH